MNIKKAIENINIDPDLIAEPAAKKLVIKLLNKIEALTIDNKRLGIENEWLRSENTLLKGGQTQVLSSASLIKTRSEALAQIAE